MGISFDPPLVREFTIISIATFSDSEGTFYRLFNREGADLLVGTSDGIPVMEVDGVSYTGPEAAKLLRDARERFIKQSGFDPEEGKPHYIAPEDIN